jgi:N-acetyl-anhydromuramyl-L-alanine amidase AmpD
VIAWTPGAAPSRFVQASDWRWLNRSSARLIVVHTTECREVTGAAPAVASFFSKPRFDAHGNRLWGSSHLVIDANTIIECVKPEHEAYGAKGGDANATGYHVELCGFAAQTSEDWQDAYSRGELALAARAASCVAAHFGIPALRLTPEEIATGASGFCGHRDITAAYHVAGGHSDPGPAFPWDAFLSAVTAPAS